MTAHYARLSDKTVREHWEKARKVSAEGRPVEIRADGPLGDAAWSKQRLSRATQSLPMFVTTAEFLPQHHAQRRHTLQTSPPPKPQDAPLLRQSPGSADAPR